MKRAVVPFKSYPILRDAAWDGAAAVDRMRRWASSDGSGSKETMDWTKYRAGFTWYDAEDQENFGAYKLPHHDVRDGRLVTHLRGVYAAYQRLAGTDMPEDERGRARSHLERHYVEAGVQPPSERASGDYNETFAALSGVHRSKAPIERRVFLSEAGDDVLMALFKERVGDVPTDDIYVFQVVPSTQALDSYGTRMAASSLQRYRRDAVEGIPLMNSHRTGGYSWFFSEPSELALGYSFDGALEGKAVDESPLLERAGLKVADYDPFDVGLSLMAWDYVRKGYWPNGQAQIGTDDLIRGIESRSLRDMSIGFGHAAPKRISYICGLCGLRLGSEVEIEPGVIKECKHIPLIRDKKSGLLAFAWVNDAAMYEHSTVWAGATPGAVVAQARRMAYGLTGEEVDYLEELWRVHVLPQPATFDMGGRIMPKNQEEELEEPMEAAMEAVRKGAPDQDNGGAAEPAGETLTVELDDSGLLPVVNELTEAVERLTLLLMQVGDRVRDVEARMDQEREQQDADREAVLGTLLDDLVAARVRALGQGFDEAAFRERARRMTADEVRAETAEYEEAARRLFKSGRPTAGAEESQAESVLDAAIDPEQYRGM